MKRLATADNLLTATLWQQVLQDAGIACDVRNQFLGGAVGELPADQVAPQLWLRDAGDEDRARALLAELRQPRNLPNWTCPHCAERLEGQFFQCWSCGTTRVT